MTPEEAAQVRAAIEAAAKQPRQGAGVMNVVGPLIGGFAGDNGALRRFLFGAAGVAAIAGNHKLGLDLNPLELGTLASTVVAIIVGSNVKEVQMAKAEAQADAVALVPNLQAAIAEMRKGPTDSKTPEGG